MTPGTTAPPSLADAESTEAPHPGAASALRFGIPAWFGVVLAASLLMLRQPYAGVRHDAVLYLGQALARLDPRWATHDFYFQFGSQDSFSLFSRVFAWPLQVFGIGPTEIGTLIVCRTVGLMAVYLLARDLPARIRWLSVLAVACISHYYGDARVFSLFEPFVTARTPAEPLAILGLAALVRGRLVLAGLALLASCACHPLVGLSALIASWAFLIRVDRRWAWAAMLALPVVALAAADVAPFSNLLKVYDEQWFAVIANANGDVFLTLWSRSDFTAAAMDFAVVWIATRGEGGSLAGLSRAAVIAALVLCVISVIGADFVHDVLLTQLQLWRSLWVTNLLASVWLPKLVLTLWHRDARGRIAALAIATAVFAVSDWAVHGWALGVWALAAWLVSERRIPVRDSVARLAMVATVLVSLVQLAASTWSQMYQIAMDRHGTALMHAASIPFALSLVMLPLAGWLLWTRGYGRHVATSTALVCALGFVAIVQYDQRPAFVRFVESAARAERPFQDLIPETATVYWEHLQLAPAWLLLRRAAFAQEGQFSGLLFNRGTAAVAMDRLMLIEHAMQQNVKCVALQGWMQAGYRFQDCDEDESILRSVCTGSTGHADYFVSQVRYSVAPLSSWEFDAHDGTPASVYFLYDCRSVAIEGGRSDAPGARAAS